MLDNTQLRKIVLLFSSRVIASIQAYSKSTCQNSSEHVCLTASTAIIDMDNNLLGSLISTDLDRKVNPEYVCTPATSDISDKFELTLI